MMEIKFYKLVVYLLVAQIGAQHSNYRTRNCRDLRIPRENLEYVKKGFHYSALKAWNDIPINIRELPTLKRFKKQLKSYYTS